MNVLDLFCGAGGFSCGFEKAGFDIVAGVDNQKCAIQTFEINHSDAVGIKEDLSTVEPQDIDDQIDKNINVIIGGPPCKGFSIANNKTGHDTRNTLVDVFLDFVEYFSPEAVVMENVPQFKTEDYPTNEYDTYGDLVESRLDDIGYSVSIDVLNSARYGVPQTRKRAIVLASKQSEAPNHPDPTHVLQ